MGSVRIFILVVSGILILHDQLADAVIEPKSADGEVVLVEWGAWSGWTKCNRACATGVTYRTRKCNMAAVRKNSTTAGSDTSNVRSKKTSCAGPYKQFRPCNIQKCPNGTKTFREDQCSRHDSRLYYNRRYTWIPYPDASSTNKCELVCLAVGFLFSVRLAPFVADGTLCEEGATDVCIRGQCQKVGCDGIVGSGKTVDKCGVCGGGGTSCHVVSGIFVRQNLPLGSYYPVTKIPKGACNINITENGFSRNFLALKTSSGESIISGKRAITRPGNYYSSGTTFKYSRPITSGESIIAKGPVTESLDMFILYREPYKGVYYEYTIPIQPQVGNKDLPSYVPGKRPAGSQRAALQTGTSASAVQPLTNRGRGPQYISDRQALTAGSAGSYRPNYKPGTGSYIPRGYNSQRYGYNRQSNGYHRYNTNGQRRPTYNQGSLRPAYGQSARRVGDTRGLSSGRRVNDGRTLSQSGGRRYQQPSAVDFTWKISGFTECDRKCGGGQQWTKVICVSSQTLVQVTDENCDSNVKPKRQQLSCNNDPCQPDWEMSEWSKCSETCGKGVQTRTVECKRRVSPTVILSVSADLCKDKARPSISHSCQLTECNSWKVSDWTVCSTQCGRGQRTREVACVNNDGDKVDDNACRHLQEKPRWRETCNEGACQKTWFHTRWSEQCSADCGEGTLTRKVYCQGSPGRPSACDSSKRPHEEKPCSSKKNCGGQWFAGEWSECKGTCTHGYQIRSVVCMKKHGRWYSMVRENSCQADTKPVVKQRCEQTDCDSEWYMSHWSQCSVTCGEGYRTRELKCLDKRQSPSDGCNQRTKPSIKQTCSATPCPTVPPVDPDCNDTSNTCKVVVQARLCKINYYGSMCCRSCNGH